MKKFGSVFFALLGLAFVLFAFPQTRQFFPDFILKAYRGTGSNIGRTASNNGIEYISIAAAGISWVVSMILRIQDIRLKNLEIEEKKLALEERKNGGKQLKKKNHR